MSDATEDYGDRTFWKTYTYACTAGCGWEKTFLLEVGLGGQADERTYAVIPMEDLSKEARRDLAARPPLPVPFVAGGCPNCQGGPPWEYSGPVIQHVRWEEDQVLSDPVVGDPGDRPHFLYPEDPTADGACGRPIIPGVLDP